jgi:hypothetical protein
MQDKILVNLKSSSSRAIPRKKDKTVIPTTFDDVRRLVKFFNLARGLTQEVFDSPSEADRKLFRISYEQLLPYYWHTSPSYSFNESFCSGSDNGAKFRTMLLEVEDQHRRATRQGTFDDMGG